VAESVLSCTFPSSNLRQNPKIGAGRVVRWWALSKPTYTTKWRPTKERGREKDEKD